MFPVYWAEIKDFPENGNPCVSDLEVLAFAPNAAA